MTEPITFFHFTDLHIRSHAADATATYNTYNRMLRVLEAARQLDVQPDFTLLTGDLSDQGCVESYQRLQEIIRHVEALGGPVLVTPGNHDDRPNFQQYLLGEAPDEARPHQAVYNAGDLKVIVLDSKLEGASVHGGFMPEQLIWLEAELQREPERDVLLAFHHPLPPLRHSITDKLLLRADDAEQLLRLIEPYPVRGILTGHVHAPYVNIVRGVPCMSGVATAFRSDHEAGYIRFTDAYGFNVGTYHNATLTLKTVMLPSTHQEIHRIALDHVMAMLQS